MESLGDSAGDLRGDRQSQSDRDSQMGAGRDWRFDLKGDSHHGSKGELRREFQRDLPDELHRGFRGDFEGVPRVGLEERSRS
jgi:hypothetical protein